MTSKTTKIRARDLGILLEGTPGTYNAITDVTGLEVGFTTLIEDQKDENEKVKEVRTGVTAILPRGKTDKRPCFAHWFPLNGNGEMTGTAWIEESGQLEGPVMITNTHSVGVVRDAVIQWQASRQQLYQPWSLPVVAETYDGWLNDINGFHIKIDHVLEALDGAKGGWVEEGNVGGGTGMICYEFKGGTGTSSRVIKLDAGTFTVGVLVQANFGLRQQLMMGGIPVGKVITDNIPWSDSQELFQETGSIIIIIATDAPLLPHQLKRLAKRAAMGLARTGSVAGNGSGDIFMAFSTANPQAGALNQQKISLEMIPNGHLDAIFGATAYATEEAILNAITAAEDMTGYKGRKVFAMPHAEVKLLSKKIKLN